MNAKSAICIVLLMAGFGASAQDPIRPPEMDRLTTKYTKAQTESQRLQACIEAIDKKIICKGCRLDALNELLGTHFSTTDLSTQGEDNFLSGYVLFRGKPDPTPVVSNPNIPNAAPSAKAVAGWRLAFKYDVYGNIVSYYLSNASTSSIGF